MIFLKLATAKNSNDPGILRSSKSKSQLMQLKNTILGWTDTYLKFLMQNIFLKIFRLETVTFDLPQPSIRKNEKI